MHQTGHLIARLPQLLDPAQPQPVVAEGGHGLVEPAQQGLVVHAAADHIPAPGGVVQKGHLIAQVGGYLGHHMAESAGAQHQ